MMMIHQKGLSWQGFGEKSRMRVWQTVIILGIDPGLARMGYGVIKHVGTTITPVQYGVLTTPAGMPSPQRLRAIFLGVVQLMEIYEPQEVAVEELFFSKNVTTGIAVAQARGAAMVAAASKTQDLFEYTPMQVKQAVAGYGKADKPQMQRMVAMLLHLEEIPKPDDAADALAVAICHAHSQKMSHLFKMK